MNRFITINKKINFFKKKEIFVDGDKSLSIRFVLLSSISEGKCSAINLLKSEDVLSAIKCVKKLGVKVKFEDNKCEISGKGLSGLEYKKNLILNAGNSGTTARLLCSLLVDTNFEIKIIGDQSLEKRDMNRIIKPLKKFGVNFKSNYGKLPLFILGTKSLDQFLTEKLGSAQCKSAIMIAALKARGETKLKCLPSRNHTG